jgi:hypothetical protein
MKPGLCPLPSFVVVVDNAVTALIDVGSWNRQLAVQEVECKCIEEFANKMKHLPQLDARP